jgi:hypothetical protein
MGCHGAAKDDGPTKAQFGYPNEPLSQKFSEQTRKNQDWAKAHGKHL